MKSELLKRSISSLFLMSLIFLSALINDYIFLSILFIVVILSWIEWIKIIEKIRFKKTLSYNPYYTFFNISFNGIYHLF